MAEFLLLKWGRFLNLALALFSCFFLVTTGWGQTVTTDKDDYAPGEYVIITGTGWQAGERVNFTFEETPKPETCVNSHDNFAIADVSGNIFYNGFLIKENHIGVFFELTAKGENSEQIAFATFTDGNIGIETNSGTVTVTYIKYNNSNGCSGEVASSGNGSVNPITTSTGNDAYQAVTDKQHILLTAPLTNSNGETFEGWSNLTGNVSFTPTPGSPNIICVKGISGNLKLKINYNVGCTTPLITTSNIQTANNSNLCSASVTMGGNITLNSGTTPVSYSYSLTSGGYELSNPHIFPIGITTVYAKATNRCGNDIKSFTVTVTDNQKPTITAPAAVTVSANASCTATGVALGTPTTADNCSVVSVTNDAPETFPLGNTTVTWTVTDGAGLKATAEQIVTVEDTTAPTITAPAALTVSANVSCQATGVELGSATTADNCSVASVTNDAPGTFPFGNTIVTWTVTDGAGLKSTATQIVTVEDTTVPTITAPAAVTVSANASCTATGVALGTPTTADNCSVVSVTNDAPETFPLGNTTVTWTVRDGAGLIASATQIITVEDTTAPTITAPAALTVSANVSCQATGVELGSATTADNCSVASVTNDAPGTFPLGNTTVTWTVRDGAGLTASATQIVTVVDDVLPTVVTQDITVELDANGSATITAAQINNGSSDNCSIATYELDVTSFDCNNVGANTVTLTVTDVNGNSSSGTATVTVQDNVAPTVVTQNITVQLDENGSATITAAQINNGSTDNCEIASYALDITSFDCSNVGANTVELTVTDVNGNFSLANASVTVQDNIAPTVVTEDITVELDANGSATITAAQINNGSTDNCEIASYVLDITSFDCSNVGANTVELTVTDVNGNSSSGTATVTVEDNVAPEALTQNITVQLDENGSATITADQINNGSNDACGIASMSVSQTEFTCANVGPNTVTLTVTDNNGNVSTTTATVTVEDNVAPVAIAQDITVQLDAAGNVSITAEDIDNGSNDACGIASLAVSQTEFTCANVGSDNTVTLTVTDNNGNVSTATATVTVEDNVAPVAIAQDITVQLDAAGNVSITAEDIDNGSNDACGIASMSVSQTEFTCANVGPNTVTLTVTDNNGNVSTATATVTVEDNVAPEALTQDITVQLDAAGNVSITAEDIDNGSNDACGIASLAVSQTEFTCANVGPNTVTLTVTDNNGNVSTATATVTVEDNVAPVAIAQDITVQLDAAGNVSITAEDIDNGSNDACGIASLAVSQIEFTCANVGPNTVTLTVTDNNGNISTATATVTVEDNVAPTVVTQDIIVELDANGSATITAAQINNGSTDNCTIDTYELDNYSFDCNNVGSDNTVTLTVTDVNGNSSSETATVTVEDNIAPTVLTQNITVELGADGTATITADQINNGSTDNCTIDTYELDNYSFNCANVGSDNTVTLIVTDVNGNSSSETATVTVEDNIAPTVLTQNITVELGADGTATITAAQINNASTDNCTIDTYELDNYSFNCANVGSDNTVTLTVTDVNGNSSSETATVTVEDNIAPTVLTQNITVELGVDGTATITAAQINNASTDNCTIDTYELDNYSFNCANVGSDNTVTLTVTDVNGNSASETATVTVEDNIAPIITTEAVNYTVESDGIGNVAAFQTWLENNGGAEATDNCNTITWTNNFIALSDGCGETGVAVVTFTAKDASGNVDTTTATFTIEDTSAPNLESIVAIHPVAVNTTFTLTAPSSDLNGISNATWYFNSNGDATATASQQVTPNSQSISGSSVSATFNFGTTKTGVYSVLLVVEDACGNRSEVVYEYVVVYDPSGGFVTGGGWITSPIINGVEYMGVEGRANFGFNAKYKTGRNNLTEVDGNTNFQFKEGDFHFKSIAHQNMSLVISGEHKATYRGIGTVNGSGSHYFIVTVIDGDAPAGGGADKFRITVFPNGSTSPSGQPVYDNEFGAAANADASTTLGGGSIVIHKPKSSGKTAEVVEKVSVTASEEAIVEILESMAVAPNPVREEARVRFSLIEDASVVLRVFDFNGREVERLFSGNVRAHEVKEVSFQRRNLMSGVYILKLTTDRGNSYDKQIIVE